MHESKITSTLAEEMIQIARYCSSVPLSKLVCQPDILKGLDTKRFNSNGRINSKTLASGTWFKLNERDM